MFHFTIRDVLWLTVVVAMGAGWCLDHLKTHVDWREAGLREAYIHEQVRAEHWRAEKERRRADSATISRDFLLRSMPAEPKSEPDGAVQKASPDEN